MDQGTYLANEDKQSCHYCMRNSALTCSIFLSSIIKVFQTVAELCSENELLTPARPNFRPPADVHHLNNQTVPSENLVKTATKVPPWDGQQ